MSLGQFSSFPFLKGWEWNIRTYEFSPSKGNPTSLEVTGYGWLLLVDVACDDCFAEFTLNFKGGSKTDPVAAYSVFPQYFYSGGALGVASGAFSSLSRYTRPSPTSTAGIYVMQVYNGVGNAETLPILYKSLIKTRLLDNSTQNSTNFIVGVVTIDITDAELFIQSTRAFDGNRNMSVDKALLDYGSSQFGVNK
jgi:hypothetical protein